MSDDIIPIVPAPTSVNACDVLRGPCACGAWHVMPAHEQPEDGIKGQVAEIDPPKSLLKAARDLRAAQRDYMLLRSRPEHDALRELAGRAVAKAAEELDRSIEITEKRQATPLRSVQS